MVKSIVTFNKGDESYTFKVRESFLCDGYEILKCKNLSNEVRNAWDDYFFATESQAIEMIEQ